MSKESIEKQIEDIINTASKQYSIVKDDKKADYIQGISNLILEACKMLYAGDSCAIQLNFERYLNKFKDGIK